VTLRRKALDERRANLTRSESIDTLLQSQLSDLELDLETAEYVSYLCREVGADQQDRPLIPPPRNPPIPIRAHTIPRFPLPNHANTRKLPPVLYI
jgi:hypothetical protein